jgi:N-acetylglucosamine-6-phosphate deacetylase
MIMDVMVSNAKIVSDNRIFTGFDLFIRNGRIAGVENSRKKRFLKRAGLKILDASGLFVSAGLIDIHIQGYKGHDVWNGSGDIRQMARELLKTGTTSFCPTTHYDEKTIADIVMASKHQEADEAGIIGIHLEGPFVNPRKKGMLCPDSIRKYDGRLADRILDLCRGKLKIMTLAPELEGSGKLVRTLQKKGVVPSAGHCKADFAAAMLGFDKGITQVTHLFNAMEPLNHREPGCAGAALFHPDVYVQVIPDGIHIHPAVLSLIFKLKGPDRVVLITDAVKAAGFRSGHFVYYGLEVDLHNGAVRSKDGFLAGSALSLDQGVRNMMKFTGATLPEAVEMATLVPARSIGIDRYKGSIEAGKDADLILFDGSFSVKKVVRNGVIFDV